MINYDHSEILPSFGFFAVLLLIIFSACFRSLRDLACFGMTNAGVTVCTVVQSTSRCPPGLSEPSSERGSHSRGHLSSFAAVIVALFVGHRHPPPPPAAPLSCLSYIPFSSRARAARDEDARAHRRTHGACRPSVPRERAKENELQGGCSFLPPLFVSEGLFPFAIRANIHF